MEVGIIGAGAVAQSIARIAIDAGHTVMLSNSKGPATLYDVVLGLGDGAEAGAASEAAEFGDLTIEAIPFGAHEQLADLPLQGRTLVAASNYFPERDGDIDLDGRTDAERIAQLLTDTTVVKAFNTIAANDIVDDSRPEAALEKRRAIFIAADDADAKARVEEFVTSVGFAPFDTGDLATGSPAQQPGTELYGARLDTDQAARLLHG